MMWMAMASLTSWNCSGWCAPQTYVLRLDPRNIAHFNFARSVFQGAAGAAIFRADADIDGDGEVDQRELAKYLDVVSSQQQARVIGRTNSRVQGATRHAGS